MFKILILFMSLISLTLHANHYILEPIVVSPNNCNYNKYFVGKYKSIIYHEELYDKLVSNPIHLLFLNEIMVEGNKEIIYQDLKSLSYKKISIITKYMEKIILEQEEEYNSCTIFEYMETNELMKEFIVFVNYSEILTDKQYLEYFNELKSYY